MFSINAIGQIDKKLIYRKRKGFDDVKKYTKTINTDLPGQATQKGYFKGAIEEWKTGGYSAEDIQAWNLYSRANKEKASGFNMFTRFKIGAAVGSKTWERLTNCNIYDITGSGFKVDINVGGDYSGKLYYGTSKLYMVNEVPGVFSVDKYTFTITALSMLTNYFFYIKNTAIGEMARSGIYKVKTTEYVPPPPVPIYVGMPAIDRNTYIYTVGTYFNKGNPANETGKLTSVEIWPVSDLRGVKVATFYEQSEGKWSTRDWQSIEDVTGGSKQIIAVDIDIVEGDLIGIYWSIGAMEVSNTGNPGIWKLYGLKIPCVEEPIYANLPTHSLSLCGKGFT